MKKIFLVFVTVFALTAAAGTFNYAFAAQPTTQVTYSTDNNSNNGSSNNNNNDNGSDDGYYHHHRYHHHYRHYYDDDGYCPCWG